MSEKAKQVKMSVRPCTCVHTFQDRTYGKGLRVHVIGVKNGAKCTVCGSKK